MSLTKRYFESETDSLQIEAAQLLDEYTPDEAEQIIYERYGIVLLRGLYYHELSDLIEYLKERKGVAVHEQSYL